METSKNPNSRDFSKYIVAMFARVCVGFKIDSAKLVIIFD